MEANAASENVMSEVLGFFACGWCSWCNGRDNSHLLREKVWRCGRQTWIILDVLCDNWWISWIYFPLIKPTRWAWSVVHTITWCIFTLLGKWLQWLDFSKWFLLQVVLKVVFLRVKVIKLLKTDGKLKGFFYFWTSVIYNCM